MCALCAAGGRRGARGAHTAGGGAGLYIGHGEGERRLLDALRRRLRARPALEATVLVDWNRGTRGRERSSAALLAPLRDEFPGRVRAALYKTPAMSAAMERVLRRPLNELPGLSHVKSYVVDDCAVFSGANLSADYFGQRQDRYVVLEDAAVADYSAEVVSCIADRAFELREGGAAAPPRGFADAETFCREAGGDVRARLLEGWPRGRSEDAAAAAGVRVYPLLQMGPWGVRHDEEATEALLQALPVAAEVWMVSGYFNLTDRLAGAILGSPATFDILAASPAANGFYGAAGPKGSVPALYTAIEAEFLDRVEHAGRLASVRVSEYAREGWTCGERRRSGRVPPDLRLGGSAGTTPKACGWRRRLARRSGSRWWARQTLAGAQRTAISSTRWQSSPTMRRCAMRWAPSARRFSTAARASKQTGWVRRAGGRVSWNVSRPDYFVACYDCTAGYSPPAGGSIQGARR